jgi:regulator of extracellular matrix RemA (YlzA/DUF370 family)
VSAERVSLIRRIMFMNTKDRIKLARKGDREARSILIRDSNKVVCSAVVNNPRITSRKLKTSRHANSLRMKCSRISP